MSDRKDAIHAALLKAGAIDGTSAPADMRITALGNQGGSKSTFAIDVGDKNFILSVYTPDTWHGGGRASIPTQRRLQEAWQQAGIPVPKQIGDVFELDLGDTQYSYELTEFCHGHQVKRFSELSVDQARELAHHVATSHKIGRDFRSEKPVPHVIRALGLPVGFVHNDIQPGNVIFETDGPHIAGIIDFERARYRPLIDEVAKTAMQFSQITLKDGKFTATMTPQVGAFLRAYNEERPLNKSEIDKLEMAMLKGMWKACLVANLDTPPEEQLHRFALRGAVLEGTLKFRNEVKSLANELREEMKRSL